jgi:hypothetical protein
VVLGGIATARDKVRRTRLFVKRVVDERKAGKEKVKVAAVPVGEKEVVTHLVFF